MIRIIVVKFDMIGWLLDLKTWWLQNSIQVEFKVILVKLTQLNYAIYWDQILTSIKKNWD